MRVAIDISKLTEVERESIAKAKHSGVYYIILTGDTKKDIDSKIKKIDKFVRKLNEK